VHDANLNNSQLAHLCCECAGLPLLCDFLLPLHLFTQPAHQHADTLLYLGSARVYHTTRPQNGVHGNPQKLLRHVSITARHPATARDCHACRANGVCELT
jgi:hypothetical protein